MRTKGAEVLLAAVFACAVSGQAPAEETVDRVFHFTQAETPPDIQEIATVLRSMTDLSHVSVDTERRALTVRGASHQIALAEWLFNERVHSAGRLPREYRPAGEDDRVRIFYFSPPTTARDLQEMATLTRSITGIPRLFIYNAPRALVLRGTAAQAALAEWLCNELNDPANRGQRVAHTYRMPGGSDDLVQVFYLTPAQSPQDLQRIAALIRSTTGVPRLFILNAARALALRGTAHQIAQAERLIQ